LGVRGRTAFIYTPEETKAYEQVVSLCAKMAVPKPVSGPVSLRAVIYLRRGHRGDIDNYLKSLCDGLNKVAWCDDSQVVRIEAEVRRCKAEDERVEIEVCRKETRVAN
jgi:Holliday junction resolvase RusA-like endonuclease